MEKPAEGGRHYRHPETGELGATLPQTPPPSVIADPAPAPTTEPQPADKKKGR